MVDVVVEDGAIVDLGSAITLYIPSDAEAIACYEEFQLHDHIESIIVDDDNKVFFAENNCLMREIEDNGVELVLGCKNSVIPKMIRKSHFIIGGLSFNGVDIKSIKLPENTTMILRSAFSQSTLEEVHLNKKLSIIDDMAFLDTNLKSVVIPQSTTKIGSGVFACCKMLKSITVEDGNDKYYSENNCLIDRNEKMLIACANNVTVPDGVEKIDVLTFYGMNKDGVITIPESVKKIYKSKLFVEFVEFEFPVTFKAPKDSYAIQFAKENGIRYIEM